MSAGIEEGAVPQVQPRRPWRHPVLVAACAMLVAFNLRPALTSLGPLLNRIVEATGIGAVGAALLTTLPVLCLGIASAFGPWLIRRVGIDLGVLLGIVILAAGQLLRGLGDVVSLFAGSGIAACGIGVAGVLLPALVKRDFSRQGWMTGFYTMVLCFGAAAGAGLTVPLQDWLGWSWAGTLALWSAPAFAAALVWIPFAEMAPAPGPPASSVPRRRLREDGLAWQVTGFMGLQSSLAYILFGWLPALLQSQGLDALESGFVASFVTLGQAPGALVISSLAARARNQRGWITGTILLTVAAFLSMVFGPGITLVPAAIVLGIGLGGCFGLGLTLIVLRASDARTAGSLSAMAQGVGYTIASLGPLGFGLAHDATGGWSLSALLFCALALGSLIFGLGAGRDRLVGGPA